MMVTRSLSKSCPAGDISLLSTDGSVSLMIEAEVVVVTLICERIPARSRNSCEPLTEFGSKPVCHKIVTRILK